MGHTNPKPNRDNFKCLPIWLAFIYKSPPAARDFWQSHHLHVRPVLLLAPVLNSNLNSKLSLLLPIMYKIYIVSSKAFPALQAPNMVSGTTLYKPLLWTLSLLSYLIQTKTGSCWCFKYIYAVLLIAALCSCLFIFCCFGRFFFQIISFGLSIFNSTCQREMVNKARSSQQEQQQHSEREEQQNWQLCFSALSTVGKSIPRQPCCHLWSFWSRLVIYRNLFAQSQYLPVGAVKICNPSLLLPCCFSCQ